MVSILCMIRWVQVQGPSRRSFGAFRVFSLASAEFNLLDTHHTSKMGNYMSTNMASRPSPQHHPNHPPPEQ